MERSQDAWTRRARAFWQERQRRAAPGALTGYLLDESPAGIGRHRFEGEWGRVRGWLGRRGLGRGACLDVGCGTGAWLRALATDFDSVEGWDYAPAMVQASRRGLKEAGIRHATVRLGEVTGRRGRAVFDFIFVGGVLMYTPEARLGPLLKSLARLLKPGGLLILRESTVEGAPWQRQGLALRPGLLGPAQAGPDLDYVAIYRSRGALVAGLKAAGLGVEAVRANRHYKLSDLTEDWLRRLDAISGGRLGRDARLAERAAAWIHGGRFFLCYPEYFVRQTLGLAPWKIQNHWFLCTREGAARR